MISLFYVFGVIAVLSTICVILNSHPMYALLYLIVSFLSISCIFFSLGAVFAGAVEIIVYAGAIMILFIFVIMMLNTEDNVISNSNREYKFLNFKLCFGVILLAGALCTLILYIILNTKNCCVYISKMDTNIYHIGYRLFGFYMLIVEMASFLLLGALVSVLHISRVFNKDVANISKNWKKNKKL